MRYIMICLLLTGMTVAVVAQHDGMNMPGMSGMAGMSMSANPIGISESRAGSGTSWLPDSTPMYGVMREAGPWHLMMNGAGWLVYDDQGGLRGDVKVVAPNWAMLMAHRNVGERNQWRLSGMVSLDPLTVGGEGYPLLFQTGETWHGAPLKDYQHPHNYIVEASAKYTHAFTPAVAGYLYLAPVGEPALGPTTYMHRATALDDPLAPIGHHWQDATHIAFGVATAGVQTHRWQVEASTFNGREPGENRAEIQSPTFDSASTRITVNPTDNLSLQASYAFLKSPEALHPEENNQRVTASVIYNRPVFTDRNLQATAVWGRNHAGGQNLDSYLLEMSLRQDGGWNHYLRYESVQKNGEELVLPAGYPATDVFRLQQATLGAVRDLPSAGSLQWGIGAQVMWNDVPARLKPVYGEHPLGWLLFLRVHPKAMMPEMAGMM